MDLHDRYLRFPTLDISVLRAANDNLEDDTSVVPHHLMQFYNCEITREQLNMSKLEIYRMLLSYEYQQVFSEIERRNNKKYIPSDVKKIRFSNIEAVFPAQHLRSVAEMSVLRDIIILQTVLYCNIISIKEHLQNFLNSYNVYTTHKDTRAMYMKVLEYFLESLRLRQFSVEDGSGDEKEICSIYLNIIKSWMKTKEDSEWGVFASMLPLLVKTFAPEHVLFPLWNHVMNEVDNLKEFFTILSIMVDTCFTSSYCIKFTCIHNDIFSKNIFWLMLLKGLQSPSQQSRKQALYIIRRATDFLSKTDNLEFMKAEITPFICSKSSDSALPADSIKQKFFLLYEALEEKQYHLVAPALTHLTSLVKATKEHESCQCFHIVWLRCILEKVLRHENNNIVKWGVSYVCKLDAIVFHHINFLELFVNILNNSFLYECQPNEDCPEIVRELATLFRCMAKEETSLLDAFLKRVSEVTWGPVAIFYVVHTLRITSQEMAQRGSWRAAELNAVKSLAETSLSVHSHVLRAASRIELLQTIPNFVRKIDDLTLVANVLAAFPRGEDFTGRNFPWNVITTWLREVLAKEDAVIFVEQTCAKFSRENLAPEVSPRTFALMVYLLYDARLVLSCKTCPTESALNNWLSSSNGIEMRPYADIRSNVDIAEFISHSLNIFAQMRSWNSLTRLILLYLRPSFMFFGKNVKRMAMGLTYEDYTRYTAVLSSYVENAKLVMPERDAIGCLDTLLSEAVRLLKNTPRRSSMQYLYGMRILNFSWDKCNVTSFYEENFLNMRAIPTQADADTLKGKIASELYLLLSRLMSDYLTSISTWGSVPIATLLTQLLKFLELGGAEIVLEVTTILTTILGAVGLEAVAMDTSDEEILEHVLQSCWRCTFAGKKNNVFWTAIRNLTGVIVNNNFFLLPGAMEFIAEFIDRLIQEGDGASRFKRILLSKMGELEVPNLMKLEKALFNCLLHGSILRRDERVENRVHLFIAKHLGQYFPKHIATLDYNNDATVRAHATTLLHRIICRPDVNYATTVAPLIFETLEKYRNKRYFNDSYIHKLKHRLMQILLILEPVMSKELVILLLQKLQDAIISESNQHSVRLMQEWLMTRILIRYSDLHDRLWKFFAESIEKRSGCTVSVASIVYHIARLLSADSRKNFIQTALSYVAKCCLGQQFNVRLYNQFIMIRLCELMKEASGDIFFYTGMYEASLAGLQQATSTKKIQDDFYFSSFHPIDDYSLQTIYFELPRLTNVSCDEWIRPNVFEAFTFEQSGNHPLKLYNVNSSLPNTTASMYLTESLAGDSLASNVETYSEGLQNIQRKLDPSKFTVPLSGDNFGAIEASQELDEEGLIVVASLVNRPPNLGGIARTCEIFGVRSLVIANLACVKDKEFQCLSVSAERWINMLQVKPHELQQYLLDKKNAGWSLIGAEQTANSVNLLEAKFERKTIFVLGNEKDGIPANLIPLFNTCVEIPQAGVIRSLNVHVTAAICIWQYASQYTLK